MANLSPQELQSDDPIQPVLPLSTRLTYEGKIRAMQLGLSAVIAVTRTLYPPVIKPSQLKVYPCRSRLENRIFLPPKYNSSQEDFFPLYLDIHGGGFCLGQPLEDDEFCSAFSQHFNIIVVSLDYSKAPQYPYPAAVNDIAAIASAVINDITLRIDKTRVAIGGFSAGGSLALAACQIPSLRQDIKACCPFYPPTDLSLHPTHKLKTRAWKPEHQGIDMLANMAAMFDYSYVNPSARLKDPKISPYYVRKYDLPEWVFIVGAEYDMLCDEARALACRLAGLQRPRREEEEEWFGWERDGGRVRWVMARGLEHGFASRMMGKAVTEESERVRRERFREIWEEVGKWLFEGPFAG